MSYIHMITGGERSGKSSYAERIALELSSTPTYVATARIWDEEFRLRVLNHQHRRGAEWTNLEVEKHLSQHDFTGQVVLVDCVTLWATNFFFDLEGRLEEALSLLQAELDALARQDAHFIFVTNEIGMGGVSMDATQRRFTELQGWLNQYLANLAQRVTLMVSGIPLQVK